MMAVAATAWKWLAAGAWKWALPLALCAVLAIDAGWHRWKVDRLEAAIAAHNVKQAEIVAEAERKLRLQLEADIAYGGRLAGDYAAENVKLEGDLQNALVRLARAERTLQCDHSPRARAFDDGLRHMENAGEAGAGTQAGAGPARR